MTTVKQFVNEKGEPIYGIMAEFATPAAIYHAAEKLRDQGFTHWDVYAPFPIHGIDEAMGIRRTRLPLIVGSAACIGVVAGYLLQWYGSNIGYKLVTQGKPYGEFGGAGGWESFVPIMFELGVLFAAFATLIGMLALNGLPRHHHPLLSKERFLRVSDDRFVICVEAADPKFDHKATRTLLESLGGTHIDLVEDQ